jgi:hypothetical protein
MITIQEMAAEKYAFMKDLNAEFEELNKKPHEPHEHYEPHDASDVGAMIDFLSGWDEFGFYGEWRPYEREVAEEIVRLHKEEQSK